jgi:hypothetical protein
MEFGAMDLQGVNKKNPLVSEARRSRRRRTLPSQVVMSCSFDNESDVILSGKINSDFDMLGPCRVDDIDGICLSTARICGDGQT